MMPSFMLRSIRCIPALARRRPGGRAKIGRTRHCAIPPSLDRRTGYALMMPSSGEVIA
jgi:hypothetical protein